MNKITRTKKKNNMWCRFERVRKQRVQDAVDGGTISLYVMLRKRWGKGEGKKREGVGERVTNS